MKKTSYRGYRFPPEIIHQAIWLYLRFTLSLRDVEDGGATIERKTRIKPTRRREYKMQRFKCPGSAQRFLSTQAATYNTFNVQCRLISAKTHRAFRAAAMNMWHEAVAFV